VECLRKAPGSRREKARRSPAEILAHIGDLLDWRYRSLKGAQQWQNSNLWSGIKKSTGFSELCRRSTLIWRQANRCMRRQSLFQGPVADALTHVGQIAVLRRLAGAPKKITAGNYSCAEIVAGRVGRDQAKS